MRADRLPAGSTENRVLYGFNANGVLVGHPFRLPLGLLPLHLADASRIFGGYTWTVEDALAYGEQRFQTFGVLDAVVVAVCHTITEEAIRLISVRKATKHEAQDYFAQIPD